MRIDNKRFDVPEDMDKECVQLYECLNNLPTLETFESCCGHLKERYSFYFRCQSLGVIARLARATDKRYSIGKWEIVADTLDVNPHGGFWLRSKEVFTSEEEMQNAVSNLIGSINYWFDDKFDEHFDGCECTWGCRELLPGEKGTFGQALESVKQGKLVAREGWNGKGMFIFMRPGDTLDDKFIINNVKSLPRAFREYVNNNSSFDSSTKFNPYICLKAADGAVVNGWAPSQTDILSNDWVIVNS